MLSTVNCHQQRRTVATLPFLPRTTSPRSRCNPGQRIPMASNGNGQESPQTSRISQMYSTTTGISPFWKEKYEREAGKYWDMFYKRHQDKFFKDRHYLGKEWGSYFAAGGKKVVLEVGCGAGNTVFPLLAKYSDMFVHACDFSPRAVDLVKMHKDYNESLVNAFVCDLTINDLTKDICPSSVDIVTMIFVLSAVSPEKMSQVLENIRRVLKPNGYVLLRDYATGDLAQERFTCKDQKISENFYVRGDGTRAFYFSEEGLSYLFEANGFEVEELGVCCKQVENRSREIVMNRRWIQAVFKLRDNVKSSMEDSEIRVDLLAEEKMVPGASSISTKESTDNFVVDISEGLAAEMFGMLPYSDNEVIEVKLKDSAFKINVLSKEYQHTCKSTGLMLWESARMMASLLAVNPLIIEGKKVLELGCGCAGICSMVAARSADLVVATDGDEKALELLTLNVSSNIRSPYLEKLVMKRMEWGRTEHIAAIKEICSGGFDVIIGTDVTYIREAIGPLFATAREVISLKRDQGDQEPALILCHIFRRVDEASLLSAASEYGFRLVDRWPSGTHSNSSQGIISSWFPVNSSEEYIPSTALSIMYFCLQ